MAQTRNIDYPTWTKRGFLFGLTLLVVGLVADLVTRTFFAPVPAWEYTLFIDMEALGIVVGLFSPILFGIVLPLTE
jgi:hypothetical protein